MDVNDNACFLNKRAALESIASNRASTGCSKGYNSAIPCNSRPISANPGRASTSG